MKERRKDAEKRALFGSSEPLAFTLTADFKTVTKDRKPENTARFPAVLSLTAEDGPTRAIPVQLGTRGHARLMKICSFVPLRVEFPKQEVKKTAFAGQQSLKLVTHCDNSKEHEQYILREYLAYKILNVLTPRSFRARLAKGTYVDSTSGKPRATRYALFVEAENDLAWRLEGRGVDLPKAMFYELNRESLTLMMLFEYMIGNTDFSIHARHNVRLVQAQAGGVHPVPYDFDLSGIVHAPYAIPDRRLGIKTVLDRLHRGPCRTQEELEPTLVKLRQTKDQVMALLGSVPDLDAASRREVKQFLDEFYGMIDRKGSVKRLLVETCTKGPGM